MGNLLKSLFENKGNVISEQVIDAQKQMGVDNTDLNRIFNAYKQDAQSEGTDPIIFADKSTIKDATEKISKLSDVKQKEIFEIMLKNTGTSFRFSSFNELSLNLMIRSAIIKKIITIENEWDADWSNPYANYPARRQPLSLPTEYWELAGIGGFKSIDGSDKKKAVELLFKKNQEMIIDCNRMSVIVAYGGLLDATEEDSFKELFSKDIFEKLFEKQKCIVVGTWQESYGTHGEVTLLANKYFTEVSLYNGRFNDKSVNSCIPGDVVYFKNSNSYEFLRLEIEAFLSNTGYSADARNEILSDERLSEAWKGEYCICTNADKFAGFGIGEKNNVELTSTEIREKLLKQAADLYDLAYEKASPIKRKIEKIGMQKPTIEEVTLYNKGYRLNSNNIIKKI